MEMSGFRWYNNLIHITMARRRIYRKTVEQRIIEHYKELLGLDTKAAYKKLALLTLKSEMNYATLNY